MREELYEHHRYRESLQQCVYRFNLEGLGKRSISRGYIDIIKDMYEGVVIRVKDT